MGRLRAHLEKPARQRIQPPGWPWTMSTEFDLGIGAGEGIRTLDPDLGKVVLYP